MGWLRLVLLVLGVGLLIALVFGNDPAAVFASLGELSWRFVVILLFPAIPVMIFDTLGWRYAFLRDQVPFLVLCRMQQPTAFRSDIRGMVFASFPVFWGMRRV